MITKCTSLHALSRLRTTTTASTASTAVFSLLSSSIDSPVFESRRSLTLLIGSHSTLSSTAVLPKALARYPAYSRLLTSKTTPPPIDPVQHAVVSTFDLFSIGVGPSSSHTVGPMRAAKIFIEHIADLGVLEKTQQMRVDLYGSLALTGVGHGTPNAILMGLEGETPEGVDTSSIIPRVELMYKDKTLNLHGHHRISFIPEKHLVFHFRESLPQHPNGMRFSAYDVKGDLIATNEFFSIGGGFVVNDETKLAENVYYKDSRIDHAEVLDIPASAEDVATSVMAEAPDCNMAGPAATDEAPSSTTASDSSVPASKSQSQSITAALPFYDAESLLRICETENLSIAQVVFRNELQWRSAEEIATRTLNIWNVMNTSIQNGISSEDEYLPGQLRVRRRAPPLHKRLKTGIAEYAGFASGPGGNGSGISDPLANSTKVTKGYNSSRPARRSLPALDWISLYALAVNEENAAGGRVVTAPTNGAAGTIPAVLKYYLEFICPSRAQMEQDIIEFMLTAAAIGMLYKRGASISAAEMGCQGEVGVACSMAAGAFTAVMGGTAEQIENAAEIGMEHNLGLTCDPPMGLVIIPCIERNALAAVKAVTASQLALNGDGTHRVTLDQVIATMRQTGIDMMSKYKETSEGGLAVNVPVC
ncbi:hypothetical protein BASA50_007833 [Batrachochytrium salamandrivorans]|uniref:L-serine ammonia-lyase n=1 Tax=Batrachochytrium salamandrivorans TaxID=1357716 RepID=A0ABQ8F5T5_9FUNG|nr:hypothetical protein BASA60_004468 [Batrachochytrium salamandrivorans]KAH6592782.1 hypothetical protein BASA50_007833 [Batrachochytrium salamandrivorans]KAH9272622.1 L-serine ammonia-lyase [Batrachochytrium salamandrivorans]